MNYYTLVIAQHGIQCLIKDAAQHMERTLTNKNNFPQDEAFWTSQHAFWEKELKRYMLAYDELFHVKVTSFDNNSVD